jgi:flagellar hook-associated protein 2
MGTVSTTPAVSTVSPPGFAGVSTYATALQQVITREMGIAELPLQAMQSQLQTFNNQATALSGLNTDFTSLQTALQNVQTALGGGSYTASSSDSTLVSAAASAGALPATYTIAVSDPGSYGSMVSNSTLPTVADPTVSSISSSDNYTLTVGGNTYNITSTGSLTSLAQAINDSGAAVQASLVNLGGSTSPDYSLVVTSTNLGPANIQLNDGTQNLLGVLNGGDLASYTVNGMTTPIQSDSRTVTLEPGVTVNLLQQTPTDQPVTVTVSQDLAAAGNALSAFASAYNTVVSDLSAQVGQNAGALSGQSVIDTLRGALREITQYTATSGDASSIADLGLTLSSNGQLSFDSSTFDSASCSAVEGFLGSASGSGFLQAATNALDSVLDPTDGSLTVEQNTTSNEITQENTAISNENQSLTNLQNNLNQQMSAADTLIASLESEKSYYTSLFDSMMNVNDSSTTSQTG